jgi:hypothetical protein
MVTINLTWDSMVHVQVPDRLPVPSFDREMLLALLGQIQPFIRESLNHVPSFG